jgi:hypothetical protein
MTLEHPRMQREYQTVSKMIEIYCEGHHGKTDGLCADCTTLRHYCYTKLERCRYQEDKPTCANCLIHCYRKSMREKIREVMRYAGPKMIYKSPLMAIRHFLDGRRQANLEAKLI